MTSTMTSQGVADGTVPVMERPPLRLALVQARIPTTTAVEDIDRVNALADSLGGWRLANRQTSRETNVLITPEGIQEQERRAPETVSVLASADGGIRAALSASSVSVECSVYTEWARFCEAVAAVFAAFQRSIEPERCDRFGVRYVNELRDQRAEGDPASLSMLLNPALTATAVALGSVVLGSQAETRVAHGDGEFVLRHGLQSPGAYLLDFDCFTVRPRPFEADALVALAESFHARIEAVFAWSLSDDYLAELVGNGGERRGGA